VRGDAGGSGQPGITLAEPAWRVAFQPDSIVTVGKDAVFVLAGDADSDYSSQITAYDLGTGKPRWATAIPFPRGAVRLWQPGVLLVPVELHGGARATEALDVSRGALRWRLPGDVIDATPETALLGGADVTLRLVRMADGTTVWSQPADGLASWTVAGTDRSPARIVVAGADGQVRILRPADGATQWQGYLPGGRYVPFSGGLIAAAGVVYVSQMGTGGDAVTAYDLDPPAPRWRFAGAPERPPAGPVATACGVVICFRDGAGTVGLDPGTGAVRWRADGWTDPAPTSDRRRLLATSADGATHALLDSADGRVVAIVTGTLIWDYDRSAPLYTLTPVEPAGSGFEVSRIRLGTGRLESRAVLSGIASRACAANGRELICRTVDDHVTVTDVG